jgi:hypothetical protein
MYERNAITPFPWLTLSSRTLKKLVGGVLALLRGSTY